MSRPMLAIVSRSKAAYSETFVAAHRNLIDADIRYYYPGGPPCYLDGKGPLQAVGFGRMSWQRLRRKLLYPQFNMEQLEFRDSLVREGVEVVLAEYGTTGAAILSVCQELKLPLIVHFHGFDASVENVLNDHRTRYETMFDYAGCVIAVSRLMEQRLLDLGCPKDKLIYNVYGPDDAFFSIEPVNPAPRRFCAIGRFVDKKAPHYTLLAFRQVLKRFPDAKLTIAGTGPLWSVCKDLVRYFGMEGNVSLPGVLTPLQVREEFARCTAFVQHSITGRNGDMEGTPVAVLEAGAGALPVIATRHGGIPDIVVDGETGFLVDEHDVDGMAGHMCWVLENPDHASAMGRAGRQRLRRKFTMAHHINTLNECISSQPR